MQLEKLKTKSSESFHKINKLVTNVMVCALYSHITSVHLRKLFKKRET